MKSDFINIPQDELLVPFPNFGAVLMQHARVMGTKTALNLGSGPVSYAQLLHFCRTHICEDISPEFGLDSYSDAVLDLIACLYHGRTLQFEFGKDIPIKMISPYPVSIDVPYVRLSTPALTFSDESGKYEYSQYHLLCAAQAVGNAFHLFREGDAVLFSKISSITDLTAGLLACLYFGKTIHFEEIISLESLFQAKVQYVYTAVLEKYISADSKKILRDGAVLCCKNNSGTNADFIYKLSPTPGCSGLGNIIDSDGNYIKLLGLNNPQDGIMNNEPSGHICVDPI